LPGKIDAPLNNKLSSVKWGEFRLGDLFEINPTKYYRLKNEEILSANGTVPLVSNASVDNGVMGFSKLTPLNPGNSISCSDTTMGAETMYYQRQGYIGYQHIQSFIPKFTRFNFHIASFIITASHIATSNGQYDYGRKFNRVEMRKTKINLPVTATGAIDFDFMESFIRELEEERIRELSAYLTVSGLDNCELSKEEKAVLENIKQKEWKFFKWDYLFDHIKQGRRLKKEDQKPGDIPFVMAGISNTGVVNYVSNPVAKFPANSITVDIFGNTFYRSFIFGAGDDTGVYWNVAQDYTKAQMLFFAATMGKSLKGKFSFGKKLRSSQSFDFKISLPVTSDGAPDYATMETFMRAVQKIVVRDVSDYAARRIAATKEITNQTPLSSGREQS